MRTFYGKEGNVLISEIGVTVRAQLRSSMLYNVDNRDIKDGMFPPSGNTNQLDFGRKNFMDAKHKVLLNIDSNRSPEGKDSMGECYCSSLGKHRHTH